jgi:hypothetical protein
MLLHWTRVPGELGAFRMEEFARLGKGNELRVDGRGSVDLIEKRGNCRGRIGRGAVLYKGYTERVGHTG